VGRRFNDARLGEVEEALGLGVSHATIVAHHATEWGVESRQVTRYLTEVLRRWGARVTDATPDEQRADLAGRLMSCYADARRRGHTKTAIVALDSLAKLLGLTRPDAQVAINVLDTSGALSSPASVRARLAELRQAQLPAATDGGDDGGA